MKTLSNSREGICKCIYVSYSFNKAVETKCPTMYAPADHLGSPLFSLDFPHSCTCWPSDQGNITVSLPHNFSGKSTVMSVRTLTSKSCRNHNKLPLFFSSLIIFGNKTWEIIICLFLSLCILLFPLFLSLPPPPFELVVQFQQKHYS